jgi:uncharacterized repeat protein (TIGR03843 family)
MSENEPQTPNSQGLTVQRVLEILEKGVIANEHGLMRWSSNYTFLVSVSQEEDTIMAVYKPQRGERPLWDFPDGTLCNREYASFLTSQALNWELVPPTVLRDGTRGIGSVQFYIDHDPEINYFTFDSTMIPQLMRLCAFDYVVNNADRKGGHCLVDQSGRLWGIDHGITFNSAPKLRTVIWDFAGQPIPADILMDLERLCVQTDNTATSYRQSLGKLITEREVAAFQARLRHMLRTKKYPNPGSGPNYPWPPV